MKTFLSVAFAIIIASSPAIGWVIEEPIDYSKQLQQADFVGIVEVTRIVETGRKKIILPDQGGPVVKFRELNLELKVLSIFKGSGATIKCNIYRAPTEEELRADGVPERDVLRTFLILATDEGLQLSSSHTTKGTHLLVYLKAGGSNHFPVTGDHNSSRSLLRLEPSNLVNTHSQEPAEQAMDVNRPPASHTPQQPHR